MEVSVSVLRLTTSKFLGLTAPGELIIPPTPLRSKNFVPMPSRSIPDLTPRLFMIMSHQSVIMTNVRLNAVGKGSRNATENGKKDVLDEHGMKEAELLTLEWVTCRLLLTAR